jgi:hypothetical protein
MTIYYAAILMPFEYHFKYQVLGQTDVCLWRCFIDMHFVTPKSDTSIDVRSCDFGFYVLKRPTDDHVAG